MNFLTLEACEHPGVLRFIYFLYLGWQVLAVAIPIILIILLIFDFSKAMIINKEDAQLKSMNLVVKRIIYSILIFASPFIVNLLMIILSGLEIDTGPDYNVCLDTIKNVIAGADTFEKYDKLLETQEEIERKEQEAKQKEADAIKQKENNNSNKNGNNNNGGPNSNINNNAAQRLVTLIKGELGKTDRTKYGASSGSAWCAYFTTWALKNTKMDNEKTVYDHLAQNGYINDGAASGLWPAFKGNNVKNVSYNISKGYGGSYVPKAGDVIWFQWNGGYCQSHYGKWNKTTQCSDHVGLVIDCDGKTITTIEGNSGGKVSQKQYSINSENVIAFGSWY